MNLTRQHIEPAFFYSLFSPVICLLEMKLAQEIVAGHEQNIR